MSARSTLALAALAVLLSLPATARRVDACASIGPQGPIEIAGEEALIVWDPANRTQHFVRTASFDGAPEDFGFLVPTPTQPNLTEVDAELFDRLFDLYRAPARRGRRSRSRSAMAAGGGGPSVQVVARQQVAGMDSTVLLANDASALDGWLARHGYPGGGLEGWLERYVIKGWYLTAFKITTGANRSVRTRAVRMSFQTDLPFYPYSEPQRAGARPRPLRVSVVAPWQARATLGHRPPWVDAGYANPPGDRLGTALGGAVPADAYDVRRAWLTVFDEPNSRRPNQDVYFREDPHGTRIASRIRTKLGTVTRYRNQGGTPRVGPRPRGMGHEVLNPWD